MKAYIPSNKSLKKIQNSLDWYFSVAITNTEELDEKSEQWMIRGFLYRTIKCDLENFDQFEKNTTMDDFTFDPHNTEHIRMYTLKSIKDIGKGNTFDILKYVIAKTNFD